MESVLVRHDFKYSRHIYIHSIARNQVHCKKIGDAVLDHSSPNLHLCIIRALREENPSNLATLCYKAVEKLVDAVESGCRTQREQQTGFIMKA